MADATLRVTKTEANRLARQYKLAGPQGMEKTLRARSYAERTIADIRSRAEWEYRNVTQTRSTYARGVAADGILWSLGTGRSHLGAERFVWALDRDGLMRLVEEIARILEHRLQVCAIGEVPYILNSHPEAVRIAVERFGNRVDADYLAMQARYWQGIEPLTPSTSAQPA